MKEDIIEEWYYDAHFEKLETFDFNQDGMAALKGKYFSHK
jgi:hypothetical protein